MRQDNWNLPWDVFERTSPAPSIQRFRRRPAHSQPIGCICAGGVLICNHSVASMDTDRIEKKILLRAPLARIWRALADSAEFGAWFGMKVDGPFRPGGVVHGSIV